jgi:hypothetical protein
MVLDRIVSINLPYHLEDLREGILALVRSLSIGYILKSILIVSILLIGHKRESVG